MIPYQTKTKKLPGTNYSEVKKEALILFNQIKKKTKRRSYIRSAYFNKQKIFYVLFFGRVIKIKSSAYDVEFGSGRPSPLLQKNRQKWWGTAKWS